MRPNAGRTSPEYVFDGDAKLGPYYNGQRWYLPGEGRYASGEPFLSAFPALGLPRNALAYFVYDPGALGAYGYARQSPSVFIDPSGLFPCWKKPVGSPTSVRYEPRGARAPNSDGRLGAELERFGGRCTCFFVKISTYDTKCVCTFGGEHFGTETHSEDIEWSPLGDVPRVDSEGIPIPEGQRATLCGEKCQAELDRLRGTLR